MKTTTVQIPYGHRMVDVRLPAENLQAVMLPKQQADPGDEQTLLAEALAQPIGTPRLRELARPGQKVTLITSDLTRPCPSDRLLPPVLEELAEAGVADDDITIVMALGLHRPMTEDEMEAAVGSEVYARFRVVNHDPEDTLYLGHTPAGTPVEIYRSVVEADLRVCLGNLELHYFAGYSGGAKAILPGCASRATLNANHAMMVQLEAAAGRLAGNPVREDLEVGAALVGADFILNVIVDGEHRIVEVVAGDVTAAHRRGCELVAQRGIAEIERPADVVLVSAGGHPKDVNLYQAQKALDNAAYAVREGGILILVAECPEGFGNATCQAWLEETSSPDEVLQRIQQEFVLGGHKAAAIASVLKRAGIYLVSALPEEVARQCGFIPFDSAGAALQSALVELGPGASVLVLPQGGSVLPVVAG
ncbi:MAG: nickel-dependent lactate racemase [Anaerolineae bacterium]